MEPHVLTVKNPDPDFCVISDEIVPQGIKVTRALSLFKLYSKVGKINGLLYRIGKTIPLIKPKRPLQELFYLPDAIPGWLPIAYLSGRKLLRKYQFHLIYASIRPFGGALLAWMLSRHFGLPFIVDARDPISCKIGRNREPLSFGETFTWKYERKIIENCSKYMVTTKTTALAYKKTLPAFSYKFRVVYNGFDNVQDATFPSWPSSQFTIIYLGNFYPADLDPKPFFQALRALIDEDDEFKSNLVFLYVGQDTDWLTDISKRYNLQRIVKCVGRKKRDEAIAHVRMSDLFFVRTQLPTNISAKLFDGLAVNIPILSTHTHPEVENLIRCYAQDYSILYGESINQVKTSIKRHFYTKKPSPKTFNDKFIKDFSPDKLTAQLCVTFDDAIRHNTVTI
ncbi:MAG: hypothetical protein U5R49_10140 [Deltaproteobacteria bacterium]|nr:hypothetical protein [Deltaproteobacteria bacterium]